MYKNQLQELAQRSCFSLPSYACVREGPDHAPRFKASVNFNGEIFESPKYCSTLRQAEHAAAGYALNILSTRGPSKSLTARVLDETGSYKNLLQETAHRAGLNLPVYTTVRSGPSHVPTFTCCVELAGMNFTGEPAKTKKQAEKNAAVSAWSALKKMRSQDSVPKKELESHDGNDQTLVAKVLSRLKHKADGMQGKNKVQNQGRGTVCRSYGINSSLSQRQTLLDVLFDTNPETLVPNQSQTSFASLLPPPPVPASSRILRPRGPKHAQTRRISHKHVPATLKNKSEIKTRTSVDDHEKNEQGVDDKPEKETRGSLNPTGLTQCGKQATVVEILVLEHSGSPINDDMRLSSPNPWSLESNLSKEDSDTVINRRLYTGGFIPQRLAPAVHIRSVIPVCTSPSQYKPKVRCSTVPSGPSSPPPAGVER